MGQKPFGIRFYWPTATTIIAVGCAIDTGAGSDDDIVISVAGVGEFTLQQSTELGTDHPTKARLGYIGSKLITGLAAGTKYTYTVTKGPYRMDFDENGDPLQFWTAATERQDYIVFPMSCDNDGSLGLGVPGGYKLIRKIAQENPTLPCYIAHIDDHFGYMDRGTVNDSAGTGHASTNAGRTSGLGYDYAMKCYNSFGLFADTSQGPITWGQDPDRLWCMYNIPAICQKGDHDSGDENMGWQNNPADGGAEQAKYAASMAVWRAFIGLPESVKIDGSNSDAWAVTIGCTKFIAPDGIQQASGDGVTTSDELWQKPTTIYGSTQVDNILAAADDSSVPFKFFLMNYGVRFMTGDNSISSQGTQFPIAGNEGVSLPDRPLGLPTPTVPAHADWKRLVTDAGGLMSLNSCNGRAGVCGFLHGDYHRFAVYRHLNATGTLQEWLISYHLGTINGASNHTAAGLSPGDTQDGSEVIAYDNDSTVGRWWTNVMMVKGSYELREAQMFTYDLDDNLLYSGKWVEGRGGNNLHDIGKSLVFKHSVSTPKSLKSRMM